MIKEVMLIVAAILMVALIINCFENIPGLSLSKGWKLLLYVLTIAIPPLGYLVVRRLIAAEAKHLNKVEND